MITRYGFIKGKIKGSIRFQRLHFYMVIDALGLYCITFLFKYLKSSQRLNQFFFFFCKWDIK